MTDLNAPIFIVIEGSDVDKVIGTGGYEVVNMDLREEGLCPWCREDLDENEAELERCPECSFNFNPNEEELMRLFRAEQLNPDPREIGGQAAFDYYRDEEDYEL